MLPTLGARDPLAIAEQATLAHTLLAACSARAERFFERHFESPADSERPVRHDAEETGERHEQEEGDAGYPLFATVLRDARVVRSCRCWRPRSASSQRPRKQPSPNHWPIGTMSAHAAAPTNHHGQGSSTASTQPETTAPRCAAATTRYAMERRSRMNGWKLVGGPDPSGLFERDPRPSRTRSVLRTRRCAIVSRRLRTRPRDVAEQPLHLLGGGRALRRGQGGSGRGRRTPHAGIRLRPR
jgi:hypothetical protein